MDSLDELVDPLAPVTRVATGARWAEGALWIADRKCVRWSDIRNNRILEYFVETGEETVYDDDAEFANGRTLDVNGQVVQCSHGRRQLERDIDGIVTPIVSTWKGARFNSPNDVVVARDGVIWFTDPDYGISLPEEGHPGDREYEGCFVFRYDEKIGEATPVITDMEQPNGLAFSPDESRLYVSDTSGTWPRGERGNHHIRVYDVAANRCENGRVFATIDPGMSDGLRADVRGNIWTSSANGVQIYAPDATYLGLIPVPEPVANLCFGGPNGTDLFIAATTSLYHVETMVTDAARKSHPVTNE